MNGQEATTVLLIPCKHKEMVLRMILDELVDIDDRLDMIKDYRSLGTSTRERTETELKERRQWLMAQRRLLAPHLFGTA